MLSIDAIKNQIHALLAGEIAHDDFEDWLAAQSWNIHQSGFPDVDRFVGAVELRLAEYSASHLNDGELRHELLMLALHGCDEPVGQMVVFSTGLQSVVSVSSSSVPDHKNPIERVIIGVRGALNSTRSSSGRTVTASEPLQRVS